MTDVNVEYRHLGSFAFVRLQVRGCEPLPVGETGEAKVKGSKAGGGSPNLAWSAAEEGWGYRPGWCEARTLELRQGLAP